MGRQNTQEVCNLHVKIPFSCFDWIRCCLSTPFILASIRGSEMTSHVHILDTRCSQALSNSNRQEGGKGTWYCLRHALFT